MLTTIKSMFNFTKKRKCLFCGNGNLTNEHIYPKWLFELIKLDSPTFQPSTTVYLVSSSDHADKVEHAQWSSDEREIHYKDFKAKLVCSSCNNGWMSELENEVKPIIDDLLENKTNIPVHSEKAYALSRWAIIKIILIVRSVRIRQDFDPFLLQLLKAGVIPEGFVVELCSMTGYFLNFHFGSQSPLSPKRVTMEEMLLADENFFVSGLQIGNIGFRITFLKTSLPVQRKQINERLFVLYPFGGKLPYIGVDFSEESYEHDRDTELTAICNSIIISDTP